MTGITLFFEIAARLVVDGYREAGTSTVSACFMDESRALRLVGE